MTVVFDGQVTWSKMTCKKAEHAWVAQVPTWPLTLVFLAQFGAIGGAVCKWLLLQIHRYSTPQIFGVR